MTTARRRPQRLVRTVRHDVDRQPFIVIWEVTRACELVCAHCRADAQHERNPFELTTDEGRRLLDEVASFGRPAPLVVLTGGDPFERPDLAELVAHGTAAGLSIALSPSVTPRLTRPALAELKTAGAKAVSLSLDGASPATHDGFRGVEGVYDATLDAARTVRDLGFRLQLNTTVTAGNLHELPDILHRVLDLDAFLWSVFLLVTTGRGGLLEPLDAATVEDVLHWLADVSHHIAVKTTEAPHYRRVVIQRATHAQRDPGGDADPAEVFGLGETYRRLRAALPAATAGAPSRDRPPRPPLDVNAGRGFVFVDHVGVVYPSGFLPLPCGSVREQPLPQIYRSSPLLRSLRDPDGFAGRCGVCEFRALCGGSRSRAYAVTGDPLATEPTCVHQPTGGADASALLSR